MTPEITLGATWLGNGRCRFLVWAPFANNVQVHLIEPEDRTVDLEPLARGYFSATVDGVPCGARYRYRLDDADEWPDPASRFQPDRVHGPSAVVDPTFNWTDQAWHGVSQRDLVFYELHVGTFSAEGTFDGVIPYLPYLRHLGVTAIEIMPVSQFPGERNWGYDGVFPWAVQNSYGGPDGLRRLVDAAHGAGLAVFLDVVYNHFGPEGNYTGKYGPYVTAKYRTPWGDAINMDDRGSDEVRRFFIESALHWVAEYHIDGFRLDATDRIIDTSPVHFLQELTASVHDLADRLRRRAHVIAESDANDARYIHPAAIGGYGLDGQWADDLHHALHALLTGEEGGYYADFGGLSHLRRAWEQAFVYAGDYSRYRGHTHGSSTRLAQPQQFVVCSQNHDQVGNRAQGDRLTTLVPFSALKLAAATVILSPYLPLLFMGEEYGEPAPFLYFTDHGDPELQRAVSEGRKSEFGSFDWQGEVPDPQQPSTFDRSRLQHQLRASGKHAALLAWYRELFRLRRELPSLANLSWEQMEVESHQVAQLLIAHRWSAHDEVCLLFAFGDEPVRFDVPVPAGEWTVALDSGEERWHGDRRIADERIHSNGVVTLHLAPKACLVLWRERQDGEQPA